MLREWLSFCYLLICLVLPEHSNRDPLFVRPTAPLDTQRQGHFREEEFSIVTALATHRVKPNAPTRHSLGGTWVGEARARGVDYAIRLEKKRERAYYVTGIDALDHISKVDGCDRKKASRQLAAAHVDGEARKSFTPATTNLSPQRGSFRIRRGFNCQPGWCYMIGQIQRSGKLR